MKGQPHRLGTETGHLLQGSAIQRDKALHFTLDGRAFEGFEGDTVLSAILASGVDTAGKRGGFPLALTSRHAPSIAPVTDTLGALPMDRTPATDGADYVTIGPKHAHGPKTLFRVPKRSLGMDLDKPDALPRPWLGQQGIPGPEADLVVVGGGVAGMSAAIAAAERGLRVVLAEATPQLGGTARLFGTRDGEELPEQAIDRLRAAIGTSSTITVLAATEVFALRPGYVRMHRVRVDNGVLVGEVLNVKARHIVLATGAIERLPIYPGNRLPGTVGAMEAFQLAQLYGVWGGGNALFATSGNAPYRLATMAKDAGIDVLRVMDSRAEPQSRFIDFSKAYGITFAPGTVVGSASIAAKGGGLSVTPHLGVEGVEHAATPLAADRLVVSGGWQPDLSLWHMAGGSSRWSAAHARIEPTAGPSGIVLAGSAAGWISRRACLASGQDIVAELIGHNRSPIAEWLLDPIYETPDGPAPIGNAPDGESAPTYFGDGYRYIERPRSVASRWPGWIPFAPKPAGWSLADMPQPLDIADVAAGVQLGAISQASAGIVAQERVAMVTIEGEAPVAPNTSDETPLLPPYLAGRYPLAKLWVVAPEEKRALQIGTLIYRSVDQTDPLKAVGVVLRAFGDVTVALVDGSANQRFTVREPGKAVTIKIVEPYADETALGAPLGSGAGPP
ncbi:FAD-dependent oxidoreductase [Devosia sp. 2618]|uniref:FAD-dependent oxidoreductase n=1 Tax=Devosia sp. 2618 TaxID=3156454 RepID=UPI0033955F79